MMKLFGCIVWDQVESILYPADLAMGKGPEMRGCRRWCSVVTVGTRQRRCNPKGIINDRVAAESSINSQKVFMNRVVTLKDSLHVCDLFIDRCA